MPNDRSERLRRLCRIAGNYWKMLGGSAPKVPLGRPRGGSGLRF